MLIFIFILVGLCVGSFANVIVYRLPIMIFSDKIHNPEDSGFTTATFNLAYPRSHCPDCHTTLNISELIPVFSWILLRGRCKHCNAKVSVMYPVIELIFGAMFGFTCAIASTSCEAAVICFMLSILLSLCLIDIKSMLLPDCLTQLLVWSGLFINSTTFGLIELQSSLYGAIYGYLLLFIPGFVYKKIKKNDGIGQGDYKLLAGLGAWFGFESTGFIVLLASLFCLSLYIPLINPHSAREKPFGPSLILAALACQILDLPKLFQPEAIFNLINM